MSRQFAPTKFEGLVVQFRTIADRRKLIGKRIGYDLLGSSYAHFGRVTGAYGREIEINGSQMSTSAIEHMAVLDDQESPA